jgi:L-seryl-tRNA(Ser) seleniumtransferase
MKAGKEEIAGLVKALELYLQQDFAAEEQMWEDMVAFMVADLADVPGLQARRVSPSEPGVQPNWIPRMYLDWDEKVIPLDRDEVKSRLLAGDPGIAVGTTPTGLFVNPQTITPGQEKIIVQRLCTILMPKVG